MIGRDESQGRIESPQTPDNRRGTPAGKSIRDQGGADNPIRDHPE